LSPDPLVQLGLAETDAHASAVTTDGSGVKLKWLASSMQLEIYTEPLLLAWPLLKNKKIKKTASSQAYKLFMGGWAQRSQADRDIFATVLQH